MIAAGAPVGADEVAHALESLDEEERVLREELAEVLARRRMLDELLKARQGKGALAGMANFSAVEGMLVTGWSEMTGPPLSPPLTNRVANY